MLMRAAIEQVYRDWRCFYFKGPDVKSRRARSDLTRKASELTAKRV